MTDVRMLQAPGDPGDTGLVVVLAVVLVLGLVLAHLRLLRAVARATRSPLPPTGVPSALTSRLPSADRPTGDRSTADRPSTEPADRTSV